MKCSGLPLLDDSDNLIGFECKGNLPASRVIDGEHFCCICSLHTKGLSYFTPYVDGITGERYYNDDGSKVVK